MTPRTWAEQKVVRLVKSDWAAAFRSKYMQGLARFVRSLREIEPEHRRSMLIRVADVLTEARRQEHARAVRIVKAEIKRAKLDQHTYKGYEKTIALALLDKLLAALQRGRTGRGK